MKTKIVVSTWYDTVTHESAENGDFDETGCEMRDTEYSLDEVSEAVDHFVSEYRNNSWENSPEVNEVLYASDWSQDFTDGSESRDCLSIYVHTEGLTRDRKLIQLINEMIENRLAAS
jgi:hypothetical protein